MVVSSVAVWDLDAGAASATMTAQVSVLRHRDGAALLVPGSTSPAQVVASIAVVGGVMWALQGSFEGLSRRGSAVRIVVTAASIGMLTVMTRMLADLGAGVVETCRGPPWPG
jgi:predicted benzoate:H+ symporter BenE